MSFFHEGDNRYGLVVTEVNTAFKHNPVRSALYRFEWRPGGNDAANLLGKVTFTETVLAATESADELVIVLTNANSQQHPLSLGRVPKTYLNQLADGDNLTVNYGGTSLVHVETATSINRQIGGSSYRKLQVGGFAPNGSAAWTIGHLHIDSVALSDVVPVGDDGAVRITRRRLSL